MNFWQPNAYAISLIISALVSSAVAVFVWRHRPATTATPLAFFLLAAAEWSLGYGLELEAVEQPTKVFWARTQYFGIVTVSAMMLLIVLQYTGREKWLTRRNLVLLATVPLVVLLLVWTNDAHGLIWKEIRLIQNGSFLVLDFEHGVFFWLLIAYSYLLLLLGTLLLLQMFLRPSRLYRAQTGIILAGTLAPWIGNAAYVSGVNPFPHLDLTPFAFTLTGLAATWGLFRFRLLDIVPVARDTVVESMHDGVLVLDAQARIVDVNLAARRLISRTDARVIGQPAEQVLAGWPDLAELLRDVQERHTQIVLGEGEAQCYYDAQISPLHNRQGELTGRVLVLRDTTALKQTEMRLREYQQQLEAQNAELRELSQAVAQSANAVMITDLKGRIEYVNPKFEQVTGYMAAEVVGLNPRFLKSGQQGEGFYQDLWHTIQSGQEWRGEFYNRRKDGTLYWEQATIAPIFDAAGIMTRFLAVKEDITARKEAEQALRESEERFRSVTQSANDAIILTDNNGNIVGWNKGAEIIFGYREQEMSGQPVDVLVPQRYKNAFQEETRRLRSEGEPRLLGKTVELQGLRKGGNEFPLSISLSAWKAGGETFYSAIIRDITERKQAEQALRQYATDLEAQNAELDAFAHTVAHDLKIPLTTIIGFSALLRNALPDMPDAQRRDFMRRIEENGLRMRNIIDELLLLASVREREEIETQQLDMGPIVAGAQERLIYLSEEHQAQLVLPDNWPVASGYGPWIEEVWANYVSNAIKYGGRPPCVKLGATPQVDGWVRFWVRDNGPGLTTEQQARLFTPFERLHQARAEGHGLGLSIVRRIVEKLGGQVGVESPGLPGQGSVFFFTLPGAQR
jgi:PAS domain S-box-containing protein